MEPALEYFSDSFGFDVTIKGGDLAAGSELFNAVALSLFTDRRAAGDDAIPDGSDDRRGYWADAYPDVDGDRFGSRLWLLAREKELPEVRRRARQYAEEALEWLLDEGHARAVEVEAFHVRRGVLGLRVIIRLADNSLWDHEFQYKLEAA